MPNGNFTWDKLVLIAIAIIVIIKFFQYLFYISIGMGVLL